MNSSSPRRYAIRPSRPAIFIAALALIAVVSYPLRDVLYLGLSGSVRDSAVLSAAAVFCSETLLKFLMLGAILLTVAIWFRDRNAFWRLICGALGAVLAYALSELLKALVTEERPCRTLEAVTAMACPQPGDWSWPSNHSVVAAAIATACLLVRPALAAVAMLLALLVALARVGVGAHYVHDVFSGLALGALIVLVCIHVLPGLPRRFRSSAVR
ncbi:phosphatase PAP2 family protein [Glutamicibacter halophytocola]|uniref:Phosphatase PAP2 family protein n=1 Tax=Glutamicibacter halophytocola TaxID=1933880 RepID=A0A5B8IH22_9MICC|nr:phosphatase PAP2 family protein [Glutamicibacter halophytocola]NQD41598.1 phosphatase PAP2 family protein [Glutamicibacter halophytocola]QDY65532.1 phosphatase PAP2 family protein [Glutamicibacter halophytocola]UUX57631.1 phosphatase PAP2 family protein [Glutamicibacter halophytocola]